MCIERVGGEYIERERKRETERDKRSRERASRINSSSNDSSLRFLSYKQNCLYKNNNYKLCYSTSLGTHKQLKV